jgi:uncharacterized phage-associated protein
MFSEEKVAQMSAFFLDKANGRMAYLKLMKLLYLSDRESMQRFGESISGDCMVSMPHGPVLSRTYDFISGSSSSNNATGWSHWIKDEANYEVSLILNDYSRDELDELTDVDLGILFQVFSDFGHMDRFEIRDYTHNNCAEWNDPHGSSYPIKPQDVYRALGKNEEEIQALTNHNMIQKQLGHTLASLQ